MADPVRFPVPDIVRRRALGESQSGMDWLAGLDELLASLERDWGLTIGQAMRGGSAAFVAEARDGAGKRFIIKVSIPTTWAGRREADLLAAANGKGYARLVRRDPDRRAILIEKLGARLDTMHLPYEQQIDIMCATLLEAWMSVPAGTNYPNGATKANALGTDIVRMWQAMGQPCSQAVVDKALLYCRDRAAGYHPEAAVLAHGDPHPANILAVPDTDPIQFKFIDPDGLAIEPAYDLGVLLRAWHEGLDGRNAHDIARSHARHLTSRTSVPAEAIWQWGFIERVSTGLALMQLGEKAKGLEFLTLSEALLG